MGKKAKVSFPRKQWRTTSSVIKSGVSNLSIIILTMGVEGGGPGGTAPPVGVRCPNFGQFCVKISGYFIFFGQYCIKILGNFKTFGQVCLVKYSERWTEKPSQCEWRPFFFLEVTTIWTEKPAQFEWKPFFFFCGDHHNLDRKNDWFVRQLSSHFSGKTLVPPQIILSSYAHDSDAHQLSIIILMQHCHPCSFIFPKCLFRSDVFVFLFRGELYSLQQASQLSGQFRFQFWLRVWLVCFLVLERRLNCFGFRTPSHPNLILDVQLLACIYSISVTSFLNLILQQTAFLFLS